MPRRSFVGRKAQEQVITAAEDACGECHGPLGVCDYRKKYVSHLNGLIHLVKVDKRCRDASCPGNARIFRPQEDIRLSLPRLNFGLDLVLSVGDRHLGAESLRKIGRDLITKGVLISTRHVGRVFRYFMALTKSARGDDKALQEKLRKQGGIVLLVDGVQLDPHSPVLYVAWDAISGEILFAERKEYRSAEDLCPILERVKAMNVKVIGICSDKEKGLVSAIAKVFPDVPHQFCHTHFIKNCARGMEADLGTLASSNTNRADQVRKVGKALNDEDVAERSVLPSPSEALDPQAQSAEDERPLSEKELVQKLCSITHDVVRATGKAPLDPPELVRYEKLESVRATAEAALDLVRARAATGEHVASTSGRRRDAQPTGGDATAKRGDHQSRKPRQGARRDLARTGPRTLKCP
jgi:hypothetical protein